MSVIAVSKNDSEVCFEKYLEAQGIHDWEFEPEFPGKRKRPDYRVAWREGALLFDVKEFRQTRPPTPGFRYVNPYRKIREKIEAARKKFKEFDEFCCSVVLYNAGDFDVRLEQPEFVMGAMLGDIGFQFEVPAKPGATPSLDRVFLGGGKMIDHKHGRAQNTTISSAVVLSHFPLKQRLIEVQRARLEKALGRAPNLEDYRHLAEEFDRIQVGQPDSVLRSVVYENPLAKRRLPRDIFIGRFDERWGSADGYMQRVFVGSEIEQIEHMSASFTEVNSAASERR